MRNSAVHSENYKGFTIKIYQDQDAQAPNEWANTDAFIVYDHRDFCVVRNGGKRYDPREIFDHTQETRRMFYEGYHVFPLYAYIHSGVSLSLGRDTYPFTCKWDVSSTGFVLVKREKGWSYTKEKARKVAESIVHEWNDYLSGNVYGYEVLDKNDDHVDSCWGFYGDYDKYVLDEAKSIVDHHVSKRTKKHLDTVKTWIKNSVPLVNRSPLIIGG